MASAHIDTRAVTYSDSQIDSANALENGSGIPDTPTTPTSRLDVSEPAWTDTFNDINRILSDGALQLVYRLVDIIILLIGLSSNNEKCTTGSRLTSIAITLTIFYFIDLTIIGMNLIRNLSRSYRNASEEERQERFRRATGLRAFFGFFKLITVCVGTSYAFSSSPISTECELMRFCVGITCVSTLLTMFIPPTKPEIPPRRTFRLEFLILSFLLIINSTYIGTVSAAMRNVQNSSCIYSTSKDLYLGAPLKSYAYAGLILFSCTTSLHILNLIVSQLCNRITNGRRIYAYYYGFQYTLNYLGAVVVIYYFSVGALFLFKPRTGGECRTAEPTLYRTLLIWQWIRILTPLLIVPLVLILCCLGLTLGIMLSYCLPASITVPLLNLIRVRQNTKNEMKEETCLLFSIRAGYLHHLYRLVQILRHLKRKLMLYQWFHMAKNLILSIKLNGRIERERERKSSMKSFRFSL